MILEINGHKGKRVKIDQIKQGWIWDDVVWGRGEMVEVLTKPLFG
jgi:hypothetical protein